MKIVLKKLSLLNFKGIRELTIVFNQVTSVWGANEAGKTSIYDAFLWLFFGKDSTGRSDFQIKTLDSRGREIPKIDHEVSAEIEVDGDPVVLKKVMRDNWVKKRGAIEPELKGNENLYYWNDVPLKEAEFQKKIDDMIKEGLFKLITSPFFFNSLKWQQRREALMRMAGDITDHEVAGDDTSFKDLIASMGKKTFEEFKKKIAAKKKRLKDDLETIPTRIDEANRSQPEAIDFAAMEKQFAQLQDDLKTVEAGLQDEAEAARQANEKIAGKVREIGNLQSQVQQVEFNIRKDINAARAERESNLAAKKRELRGLQDEAQTNTSQVSRLNTSIASLKAEQQKLGEDWANVNAEEFVFDQVFSFDPSACICPTCKQALPADQVESSRQTLEKNFNDNKAKKQADFNTSKSNRIKNITDRGFAIGEEIKQLQEKLDKIGDLQIQQQKITTLQHDIAALESEHNRLNETEASQVTTAIANSKEIADLNKQAADLQAEIDATGKPNSKTVDELKEKKENLTGHITQLTKDLALKDQIAKIKQRIADLEAEEKNLAQQIADLEKTEFTIQEFTRAKIDALESRINGKFKHVKFKMFDMQINGAEVETCETTYKGVPFSELNNAAKYWAGIDIINAMCQHYNVSAPIFLDNRESVTAIPETDAQIINLIVSPADKRLRVGQAEELELV